MMLASLRQALLAGRHACAAPSAGHHARGLASQTKKGRGGGKAAAAASAPESSSSSSSSSSSAAAADAEAAAIQEKDAVKIVLQAIENVRPQLAVKTKRVATRVLYVPGVMPEAKSRSLAVHWLVDAATSRKAKSKASMAQCLAMELLLAYQKQGGVRQKRDDLHKLALANRANLHMRWW
jgi:small subunit ribosomal protein S7